MLDRSMMSRLSQISLLSPSSADYVTDLFETVSKFMDCLVGFYLSNPRSFIAIFFLLTFFAYYLRLVVRKPVFFCADGKFRWFLLANCPKIQELYWPPIWAFQTHVQTAVANFLRGRLPKLPYNREEIYTPDGGLISLDWYAPNAQQSKPQQPEQEPRAGTSRLTEESKPIALFIPGLTGDSQTEYIKSLIPIAHSIGYRAVVFNNRGRGKMELLTPRLYCAANYDDLKLALQHIRHNYPESTVVATGVSLGGIVLARYLIHAGDSALVDAAFMISVCWDLMAGSDSLEKPGLNFRLNQHLTKTLCDIIKDNRSVLEGIKKVNIEEVVNSKSLRDFDDNFTSKMWGFKNAKEYYSESTHKGKLCCIKRPTLCVNAADDMFAPVSALPLDEVVESSHVAMIVTSRGGHIGFMEGFLPFLPFYTEKLLHQYLASIHKLKDIRKDLIY